MARVVAHSSTTTTPSYKQRTPRAPYIVPTISITQPTAYSTHHGYRHQLVLRVRKARMSVFAQLSPPWLITLIPVRLTVIHPSSLTFTQSGVSLARSAFSTNWPLDCPFSLNYLLRRVILISHYTLLCYISSRLLDRVILTHSVTR